MRWSGPVLELEDHTDQQLRLSDDRGQEHVVVGLHPLTFTLVYTDQNQVPDTCDQQAWKRALEEIGAV